MGTMSVTFFILLVLKMAHDLPKQGRVFMTQMLLLRHIGLFPGKQNRNPKKISVAESVQNVDIFEGNPQDLQTSTTRRTDGT